MSSENHERSAQAQASPARGGSPLVAEVAEEVFDFGEEAFGFGVGGAAAAFFFEFAQKLFLALRQIDRGFDDEFSEHIAPGLAVELGHTLAAQAKTMAGLGAFRDLQACAVAVDGGHLDLAAEGCGRERDGHATLNICAVALEHAVGRYAHENVEIAWRAAASAGFALASETDARAVLDTVRDFDGQRLFTMHPAGT